MVDHMARKLGTYLRLLGYDAAWDARLRTHDLINRANAEGRVFLTLNKSLAERYPQPRRAVVLQAAEPAEQLRELAAALNLDLQTFLFTRCALCNTPLEPVPEKGAIAALVHPNVYRQHDRFLRCPSCGRVFWRGAHARNTLRKLGLEERGADS